MMNLAKVGYTLIGIGIGLFSSSFILEHELNKPVGVIEEYIPREDRIDGGNSKTDRTVLSQSDQEGTGTFSKDIPQGRRGEGGSSRNGESGQGENRSHTEFGSVQDDLFHFYKSPEGSLRESGVDRKRNGGAGSLVGKTDGIGSGSEDDQRRAEFEARRTENKQNIRYSKMYKSEDTVSSSNDMGDILHSVSERTNTRESYKSNEYEPEDYNGIDDHPEDDEPEYLSPFEIDIHDEYTLERIEGCFEVFIGDSPMDAVPLTYYAGDYTLCDDGEQIISEDVVGMAALNRLIVGGAGVENGVIYVHNVKTSVDYEVTLDNRSYKETVAGLFDEKMRLS